MLKGNTGLLGKYFQRFRKFDPLYLLHKTEHIASGRTSETVPDLPFRRNIKRRCFFVMKRTAGPEIHTSFLNFQIAGDYLHHIQFVFNFRNVVFHFVYSTTKSLKTKAL